MRKFMSALTLFLVSFLFLCNPAFSQDDEEVKYNTKKHEINIGVADIFAKSYWWYTDYYVNVYGEIMFPYYDGNYHRQPNLVIGYKCHFDKGALRLGTNFRYNNNSYEDDDPQGTKLTYGNWGTALNVGYEWNSVFGRVNFFYGLDGSVKYTKYEIDSESKNSSIINTDNYEHNETCLGISPLLGINFFITPALSIGTEVKLTAEYVSGDSKYQSNTVTPYVNDYTEDIQKRTGFRTYFGPLGYLSINIHL
jgi:hypothetical protein